MNDATKAHTRATMDATRSLAHHLVTREGRLLVAYIASKFFKAASGQCQRFEDPESSTLAVGKPVGGKDRLCDRLQHIR
jgi:hypothetical protein